jgi:hypothetical protein
MGGYTSSFKERDDMWRRWTALQTERASWVDHWKEISSYILPRSGQFVVSDANKGTRKHNNIYDSTGTRALRVLAAGLMGGATSPARPWFRLATPNTDLMGSAAVQVWLSQVTRILLDVFSKSNTYRVLHTMYEELGAYGTACAIVVDDFKTGIRLVPLTAGEYCLATDFNGDVTTVYRELQVSVGAMVKEFGYSNCSDAVKNMHSRGNLDAWVKIIHVIEPRYDRNPNMKDQANMPWRSVYMESGANQSKFLRDGGFNSFRVLAPRWAVSGGDIYGNSPGMEALGDIKQLQHQQLRKAEAIDYSTRPPLQAPTSLKNQDVSRLPGGITYIDSASASTGVRTMFETTLNLQHLLMDIQDVRQRINQTFYTDLFLMLSGQDVARMTATEVAERHEEKLLMLGPVLERLHNELLDPLVSMTFERMMEIGQLPPPPKELEGVDLNVDFVSMLAQAQRSVATNSVDRFVNNLGAIASMKPNILDKFDEDKWADKYADMLGIDPEMIVAEDKVKAVRDERAQQQKMAQQAAMAESASKTAKNLATSSTNQSNALTDVTSAFSGYT